jgi:hypothetical protein
MPLTDGIDRPFEQDLIVDPEERTVSRRGMNTFWASAEACTKAGVELSGMVRLSAPAAVNLTRPGSEPHPPNC